MSSDFEELFDISICLKNKDTLGSKCMEIEKNRKVFIDMAKGVGIVLMIMGHVRFGDGFYKLIHVFHMPMFFILSGYMYKEHPISKSIIIKRIRQLLVPYYVVGSFHYIIWYAIYGRVKNPWEYLFNFLWMNTNLNMPIAGAIWFLSGFFVASLLFMLVMNYLKKYSAIVCIFVGIGTSVITSTMGIRLPLAIDTGLVGLGFMYIGYLWRNLLNDSKYQFVFKPKWIKEIGVGIVCLLFALINGVVNMRTGEYCIVPLTWINAIVSTIVITNICNLWENRKHCGFVDRINTEISYIGRNSIIYLCFNQLVIMLCKKTFCYLLPRVSGVIGLVEKVVITLLCIVVLHLINEGVMRTKLKEIYGK